MASVLLGKPTPTLRVVEKGCEASRVPRPARVTGADSRVLRTLVLRALPSLSSALASPSSSACSSALCGDGHLGILEWVRLVAEGGEGLDVAHPAVL